MGRKTVYNRISKEQYKDAVNDKNKELQIDFCEYLRSIDRSEQTIYQYNNDLNIFFIWNLRENKNKFFVDIKKRDFVRFQSYCLDELKWSPKRIRRVKSTISSLSNYIENILDDEFDGFRGSIRKIESPVNEPSREKTIIPDEDVELLLKTLTEREEYERACAVAICAYSGMRKAELLQMQMSFFNDDHIVFNALYKTDKVRAKGRGKNGKQISKYVMLKAKPYIDAWREERKRRGVNIDNMFVSFHANVWSPRKHVDSWTKEFSEIIDKDVYWHSFRHYTCTKLLNDYNLPQEVIREFFQWNSLEMISIYNDRSAEEDFGKYFTADGVIKQEVKGISDLK